MATTLGPGNDVCVAHEMRYAMPAAVLAPSAQIPPYPRTIVRPVAGQKALVDTHSLAR